jgi:hypothetical protein
VIFWLLLGVDAPRLSPHGARDQCVSCHSDTLQFATGTADGACRQCHDDDPHAVGLTPTPGQVPADFPLVEGKLACLTCHDEPACEATPSTGADFLRGGPYAKMGELCVRCHPAAKERFDPHAAMAQAPGDPHTCEHCHETAPDRAAPEADLKVSGPDICQCCHTESRHAGMQAHRGPLSPEMAAAAKAHGLPLGEGDTLVCLTCHDAHPPGATAVSDRRQGTAGGPVLPRPWLDLVWAPALTRRSCHTASKDDR